MTSGMVSKEISRSSTSGGPEPMDVLSQFAYFRRDFFSRLHGEQSPSGNQTTINISAFSTPSAIGLQLNQDMLSVRASIGPMEKIFPAQRNLGRMVSDLRELLHGDEEDDYGVLRPTMYAFGYLLDILFACAATMELPYGTITTDYEGGIRVTWKNAAGNVRLIIPAQGKGTHYIYFEAGTDYHADPVVTPKELCDRLQQLRTA